MPQYRDMTITIRAGDIVSEPADGILTLINSSGDWFGGVDGAIKSVAGNQFHRLAEQQMPAPVRQGTVIFADGSAIEHRGAFRHVIFIVDDLQLPLEDLVKAGVEAAYAHGLKSISLPMMRTGVMAGVVEKTPEEVALHIAEAIKQTADAHTGQPLSIKIVIYSDASLWQNRLLAAFAPSRLPDLIIIDVTGDDEITERLSDRQLLALIAAHLNIPEEVARSIWLKISLESGMEGVTPAVVNNALDQLTTAIARKQGRQLLHLEPIILFQEYEEGAPVAANAAFALAVFRLAGREPRVIGVQQTGDAQGWRIEWGAPRSKLQS
jgi:O-acetyl-ADP-ribose deacetylase (regulator of RNase III)